MPITLITGPANAGKAELVMESVRAHLARQAEPLLIVPTRADVDHYRRELACERAVMGAQVQRFRELMAAVVRCAGGTTPVLGALARERMLAAIAAREAPGIAASGASGAFARALAQLVAELQERRASPGRLRGALRDAAGARSPVAALADVFEAYLAELQRIGRIDEEQQALRALDALRRKPALWGSRPVLFYGFDDLTRLQLDAIETLGVLVGAEVTVSLTFQPGRAALVGRAGTFNALAPLASRHHALAARAEHYAPAARRSLGHLERSLFEPDVTHEDSSGALRLIEGADERGELRLVASEIASLLAGGMRPEQIAVVARTSPASADLLEEVFQAAGIPFALPRRRRFADSSIGAALLGALRCVASAPDGANGGEAGLAGDPSQRGRAGDLLAWLRAPGVLTRPELADHLEAAVRRTGAASAAQAMELWEQRNWPLGAVGELGLAQARGPAALIARADRELLWLFSAARRRQASVLGADELQEAGALTAGSRALAELADLARLAPQLAPQDACELADCLNELEHSSGEHPAPGTVAVLDPLALRARRVRALFLCRLQEGLFPSSSSPPALLSEDERRQLAEASGLLLGEQGDGLAAERYLLYAAVSRPEELLVLSWHSAGEDGRAAVRSLFADDICDLFDERLREQCLREQRLDAAAVAPAVCGGAATEPIAPLRNAELLAELAAHRWSPSSLGLWVCCPVRWLVERMLRAQDLEADPEPLARGGLAHAALAQTLEGLKQRTGSARISRARLGLARELLAAALSEHEANFALSVAPERRAAARRWLRADLERYLEHAAARAEGEDAGAALEPAHMELEFGFDDDGAPASLPGTGQRGVGHGLPALDLGGGMTVRGRIDRIDVTAAGEGVVYDYKGANVAPAAKWVARGDLQIGLYMHAVESLLGLRAVGGFYQPLSGSDLRARGLLELGAGVQLQCVGDDAREPQEVRAVLEGVLAAAREAAAQAARGELQPRPQTCAFKGGCSHPAICRCET